VPDPALMILCSGLADGCKGFGQGGGSDYGEKEEEYPDSYRCQGRCGNAAEDDGRQHGYSQPEGDIDDTDDEVDDDSPYLFDAGNHAQHSESESGYDQDDGDEHDGNGCNASEELAVDNGVAKYGLGG